MSLLSPERTYQIVSSIVNCERLDDLLDLLGAEINALGVADGYLVNMRDATGNYLTCLKIRYPAEFQNLERSYLGYKIPLDNGQLNARTMATREIVRVNPGNASDEENTILNYWKIQEMVALPLCLPEAAGVNPIGVLVLLNQGTAIPEDAIAKVQAIINLFHASLSRWLRLSHLELLHDEATAAVAENKRLLQFLDDMNSLTSVDKIYELFAAELFRQMPFDLASFCLVENDRLQIGKAIAAKPKFEPVCEKWEHHLRQTPYPLDPTASGLVYVLLRDEAMVFPDFQEIRHLPLAGYDKKSLSILGTARTLFITPIRHHKKPIGVFALYSLENKVELSDADLHLLGHLSSFLGTAITNSKLYATSQAQVLEIRHLNEMLEEKVDALATQASTDQLTGLLNFRAFEQELDKLLDLAAFSGAQEPLALALIDIDHFKRFNDTNGHAAGNDILAALACEIGKHTRQSDKACRYGGEEFVLILPKCGQVGAVQLAERIRSSIEARTFDTCAGQRSITISVGYTVYRPGDDRHSLFNRADQALYQAKESGRNRVCSL
ncbi:sensor domain-containing diguanylate cyclase [Janthinobacterium sp. 17J80-10]|uniref:sensor domain-containing diguanylate cyclase n=1 Tax=Janthinobacterium sp. 17J80-10 TaxID=2497863 RepID=UPI0010054556|nr:sensor domain-containing diguanylate cyclase [Janthinobacterium sp. 17J80-10]QAU35363.1 sensor domain-containing diguanylate cyclase [Janthinobacterium sp. 17J80-10]